MENKITFSLVRADDKVTFIGKFVTCEALPRIGESVKFNHKYYEVVDILHVIRNYNMYEDIVNSTELHVIERAV